MIARPGGTRTIGADVVVVGGGPGGSVTALLLARLGLDVLLVDRARFPRPKACGDCLSAGATALLARLGLLDRVDGAGAVRLDGWTITSPGGNAATGRFGPHSALALERRHLDAALRDAALEAGVRPLRARALDVVRDRADGRAVGVLAATADARLRCDARLVVGADGLRSIVARRLGTVRRGPRLRKLSLTTHVTVGAIPSLTDGLGRMHVLSGGCVAMAPVGHGRVNVTLVVHQRHAPRLARTSTADFLRHWLGRLEPGQRPVGRDADGAPPILASGPFDWPSRGAAAPGAALVGDAAGYFDPFTGQGVHHAMAAAEALVARVGPVLAAAPGTGPRERAAVDDALASYARSHRALTAPARRLQGLIEGVLARPRIADAAIARLARAPAVMNRLIEVTGDLRAPATLFTPAMLASFLHPGNGRGHDPDR